MSKIAIAFGGGGTRGAYQMGVWRALRECGIKIDIAVGTSVGALMGAVLAQDSYEDAEKIWNEMDESFVINTDEILSMEENQRKAKLIYMKKLLENGGADITPLEKNMEKFIDEEKIRSSEVDFGLVTVEYPHMKPIQLSKNEIPRGKLVDYIIASASCFPAFRVKEIDGVKYIDGGYHDNLPVNLAFKMGADVVIAVDLHSFGIVRPVKNSDDKNKIINISSHWSLGNFLSFDKELVAKNMILGYNDTMKVLGKLDGDIYTFSKGEELKNYSRYSNDIIQIFARLNIESIRIKTSPIDAVVRKRLLHKLGGSKKNKWESFTSIAELTGEIFEISPEEIYTFESFNNLLKKGLSQALGEISKVDEEESIREQIDSIREMGRKHIAAVLYRYLIKDITSCQPNLREWKLVSLVVPSEIASAFYLATINFNSLIDYR